MTTEQRMKNFLAVINLPFFDGTNLNHVRAALLLTHPTFAEMDETDQADMIDDMKNFLADERNFC